MKPTLLSLIVLAVLAVGCSKNEENVPETKMPAGTGQATNPGGRPLTADEQKQVDERKQAGDAMGARMEEAAKQMEEARKKSGGK